MAHHDIADVIAQRVEAMASATLAGRLPPHLLAVARSEIIAHPPFPTDFGAEAIERGHALGQSASAEVSKALAELAPQAEYAGVLVRGVRERLDVLDRIVARIAPEWPVDQMAPVDRNLLRIAIWEISTNSAPERVAINEAVELARQYSGEGARRLVNGALGTYVGDAAAYR
jgi:transcription antitermination factor NusB